MVQKFAKMIGTAIIIFGTISIAPLFSSDGEPPYLLPQDRDSIFRDQSLTSTRYLQFGQNGNYRQINREHLFVAEMDRGTWKQDALGEIELQSSIRLKELKKGPFRIDARDIEQLEALRSLEKDIEIFMETDKSASWPREKIENAWKYTYTRSMFKDTITVKAVAVEKSVEQITRMQLIQLLDAWRAYLKDDTQNRFHFLLVRYQKFILLASMDYPFLANAKTPDEVKKTAGLFSDKANTERSPNMVYVLVDDEGVLNEMKQKQPFIFYPQLTQGGEEILTYK